MPVYKLEDVKNKKNASYNCGICAKLTKWHHKEHIVSDSNSKKWSFKLKHIISTSKINAVIFKLKSQHSHSNESSWVKIKDGLRRDTDLTSNQ